MARQEDAQQSRLAGLILDLLPFESFRGELLALRDDAFS